MKNLSLRERLYAVDPGLRCCGMAYFENSLLQWARLVETDAGGSEPYRWIAMSEELDLASDEVICNARHEGASVVVEFPKAYVGAKSGGDYEDLLQLAAVVGAIRPTRIVRPHEWKGQMKKDPCNRRVLERLDGTERSHIEDAGAKTHNVLDAVGIGLYCLGRFERRRVFSR